MEFLADNVKLHRNRSYIFRTFSQILRGYADIFSNNIYAKKEFTHRNQTSVV